MTLFAQYPWTGAIVRANESTNPRAQVNTTGWIASTMSGGGTLTVAREGGGTSGFANRIIVTASAPGVDLRVEQIIAVTAGLPYTFSATYSHTAGGTPEAVVIWRDASNNTLGTPLTTVLPTAVGGFQRASFGVGIIAPAGAVTARVLIRRAGAFTTADVLRVTGALFERNATTVNPYYDGATPNDPTARYTWTGTAGNSTTTVTAPTTAETLTPAPFLVETPWAAARPSNTLVHALLDSPDKELFTYRPPGPRRGELRLLFASAADSAAAFAWFSSWPTGFAFNGSGIPAMGAARFVVDPDRELAVEQLPIRAPGSAEFAQALILPWREVL